MTPGTGTLKLWDDALEGWRPQAREALAFLAELTSGQGELPADPLERARVMRETMDAAYPATESPLAQEETIPGPAGDVPARLFVPDEPKALFLHIHGGGFALGHPRMNDQSNEELALRHGLVVLSVDYRLAPEHPYPAGPDDCEAAARWLLTEGAARWGVDRLLIGGESAGANLALVTLLRIRDRLGMVDRVLGANLVFGVYDLRGTPSQQDDGGLPDMLSAEAIRWFHETYTPGLTDADRIAPDISPLWADLSGLPPALITVGGCDHLRDDSLFLAMRWAAAESPCELAVYPDSPHGFQALPTPMAQAAVERVHGFVAQRLATVG